MPWDDGAFKVVVFDPPHMVTLGPGSWMAKKYGRLAENWRWVLMQGFAECFRVLATGGVLVFKWNETDVKLSEVLPLAQYNPAFGHTTGRQAKTIWVTFFKSESQKRSSAIDPILE